MPDSDETVATGAAVQAAAVVRNVDVDDIVADWPVGTGEVIEPTGDPEQAHQLRRRFTLAAAAVGPLDPTFGTESVTEEEPS